MHHEDLSPYFTQSIFERGAEYAQAGHATLDECEYKPRGELVLAGHCRSSRDSNTRYQLRIVIAHDEEGFLDILSSECSCPVHRFCKHAVALLLTYSATHPAALLRSPIVIEEAPQDTIRDETREWLNTVLNADQESASTTDTQPRLIYLLSPGSPAYIQACKSHPLKRGGMSKPSRYVLQSLDLSPVTRREYIRDDDTMTLRLMLASGYDIGYFNGRDARIALEGEAGTLLLNAALRTGRLYLENSLTQPLQAGTARPLQLQWRSEADEQQRLAVTLPPAVAYLPTWPPHYVDGDTFELGVLHSELPDKVLQALLAAPTLNPEEAALVRARLEKKSTSAPLPLPHLTDTPPAASAAPPQPRLRLTMGRFRQDTMFGLPEDYPVAELYFDYVEGVSAPGCEQPDPLIRLPDEHHARMLQRDLAAEQDAWQALVDLGLESQEQRLPHYTRVDAEQSCLLASPTDLRGWLPLLGDGLPHLQEAGWIIDYADNFPFRLATADDWFVDLAESEEGSQDWFDLDLGVLINGERVSLVPPLLQLLREQPRMLHQLNQLDDSSKIPLKLDHRRVLQVPVPRLRGWLRPLLEFLDGDRPRVARHHAAALIDLDDQPSRWLGGEALRELGQKLRNFTGLREVKPAPGFNATLRPYQQDGLNWLQFLREFGLAGVLADDMGLGKTVQTLAHLHLEHASGRADLPSLVVAPTSLLPNWAAEAQQFAPSLKVLVLHGPARDQHYDKLSEFDLILTTYSLLVRDRDILQAQPLHVLVLDEAQFIKNPKAQSHQVARRLQARHRLSLTGTPLENHLGELWAQFDFLMPGLLGGVRRFNEVFRNPIEKMGDQDARQRLAARVAPFLLRRTKDQVLQDLPSCTEIVRWVELSGAQRDLYEALRVAFDKKLRDALAAHGVGRSQIVILDALLKLRQACCDPRLVKLDSARNVTASAKLEELLRLVEELLDEGRRILLFSQFTTMLDLIEAELQQRGIGYTKLTGQTHDRDTPVRDFQEGRVPVFLISLKAGGTGLNLTAADTVIHYDPWWNPAAEAQATARAHRIGQDKPVFVYKLLGRGTVEEKILALQTRKQGLAEHLLDGQPPGEGGHLITAQDLDVLFEPLA